MKIGIITFWDSQDNFGQLLQCFALQRYLNKLGHSPYLIRYKAKRDVRLSFSTLSPAYILSYIKYRLNRQKQNKAGDVTRDFDSFRLHINFSEGIYHGFKELVAENWEDTDAFICGSDQIWSHRSDDELRAYYLQFTPFQKKRIAYAPSFGRDKLDDTYAQLLPELTRGFDFISVREQSGVDILKEAGTEAELVCDPTILLGAQDYCEEFHLSRKVLHTCFCYFINWDTDIDEDALILFCEENGLKPVLFSTQGYKSRIEHNPIQSPETWLKALCESEFAAVNSFHGVVFSILFHVPFAVYLLKGNRSAMNGRIHSLLSLLGLTDRIVSDNNSVEAIYTTDIDWKSVDEKLSAFRGHSIDFMDKALNLPKGIIDKAHYNICFLTSGSVHHYYGGLDRVTEILADKFEADGHRVSYLSVQNRGKYNSDRQHFLPDSQNRHCVENSRSLTDFLKNNNIDILINQEGNVNMCIPFEGRERVKTITCLHFNPNYIDDRHFFYKFSKSSIPVKLVTNLLFKVKPINSWCLRYLRNKLSENYRNNLLWCDKFILLSSRFKDSLLSLLQSDENIEKIESIYNPNVYNPKVYNEKENIILYVGRLDNNFKRIDTLIDDISSVLRDNRSWRFIICGDGPDREYLQSKAKTTGVDIDFAGYCNPVDYYNRSSIIVLRSSKSEGWGMVLIEAMSHGVVPVVSGTYESLYDIIDQGLNGIITKDSHLEFSSVLSSLINDKDRLKAMSRRAVEKASDFDVDNVAKQWYRLFEK